MKKLINLIALVMLVSTNVLTPFSYAQEKTPEVIPENEVGNVVEVGETPEINEETSEVSEEIPEANPEEKRELEQGRVEDVAPENVLPDIQNDVETPAADETEEEDAESDEVVQPVEEISENEIQDEEGKIEELEKDQEMTVMDVIPNTEVTLLPGQEFNSVIKTLANGGTEVAYAEVDNNIQSFQRVDVEPAGVTTGEISIAGSEYPVYARFSGGVLYYATQAETIQLNPDSQSMFGGFSGLTGLDLSSWDISNVTNMSRMFSGCANIEDLILDNWDFSNNPNIGGMFLGLSSLKTLSAKNWIIPETFSQVFGCVKGGLCTENIDIDVSNWDLSETNSLKELFYHSYAKSIKGLDTWDTSSITNMNSMFRYSNKVTKLDISKWDTSNVTDMAYLFYECWSLVELDVSNWNTSRVTTMYYMFRDCHEIVEMDLSKWDTRNLTDVNSMFMYCNKLKKLNLDNWDTSKVTNIGQIFNSCYKLEELSMSGWDFRNIDAYNLFVSKMTSGGWSTLKKLNMTNTKFSGSMNGTFHGISGIEEIKLDGIDTSNVTDMKYMFQGCRNLTGLDLSSLNTSNVTGMSYMFDGCTELVNLNLSGWDFRKVGAYNLINNISLWSSSLKTLNMTNASFSGSMHNAFQGLGPKNVNLVLDNIDTSNVTAMSSMFNGCSGLTGLNLSSFDTSKVTEMSQMFFGCSGLQSINLSNFDTSNVTNMSAMFYNCSNLDELNLSNFDTSNVRIMNAIFYGCNKLKQLNLNGWDFKNISNMGYNGPFGIGFASNLKNLNMKNTKFSGSMQGIFNGLTGLQEIDLEGADTSNVINMNAMFYGCSSLTGLNLSNWNTSNVTGMEVMFSGCNKLESLKLDNWDLSKNPNMGGFISKTPSLKSISMSGWKIPENFQDKIGRNRGYPNNTIEEIDVTNWDLNKTKNLQGLFGDTKALKTIKGLDTWDTSGVTNMYSLFYNCNNLTRLDLSNWDTSNVTNMYTMFYGCSSLTGLDLSNFDTSNVSIGNMQAMFNGCSKLENLNLDNWVITGSSNTIGGMFGGANNLKKVSMRNWTIPENFTSAIGCGASQLCATGLESIDVSNWKLSGVKNLEGLFGDLKAKEIKGLNTWDTSSVTNMSGMFRQNSNLTGLDLSNWNTSNVTNMGSMFSYCSNLTGLDLSNFDTSNVINFYGIFGSCYNLEEINLSGRDFRNYNNSNMMMNIMWGTPQSLKKLNMTNTKYTGNATYAFGGLTKLEELNLDGADTKGVTSMHAMFNGDSNLKILNLRGLDTSNVKDMSAMFYNCSSLEKLTLSSFDTSNVTSMWAMFYGCSGLNELDLTNFNTPKVTAMGQMFFNTQNLKTIYASENFVTTTLSGDNSSKDMFSGTTSVIGGNGTKFDSGYTDKTYALIDKVGQTGYFTDKNAINVKFINTLDGTETTSTFAKGQKLTPPSVNGYHVAGGYLDEAMTQEIDLNKGVDSYSEIYVKYNHNGSSGGGGGGGATKPDTPKDEQQPAEPSQSDASTGTNIKEPESNTGSNIQTGIQVDSSEQTTQNDNSNIQDSPTSSQDDTKIYSTEFQEAYEFAKGNGITTMPTIQKANMEGKLTRIAMAKMLSQYAVNVLGKTPDTSKTVKFKDVSNKKDADYDNGVTLAYQLGIMGQNMPGNNFRPNDEVTRAEFATALSRMAYNTSDGEYKSTSKYYIHHMEKLVNEGIITNDNPNMKELRGYVMIMLMRSSK